MGNEVLNQRGNKYRDNEAISCELLFVVSELSS